MNCLLPILALVCLTAACGKAPNPNREEDPTSQNIDLTLTGEELFIKHCKICHGADGRLGLNGAKDLQTSTLTLREQIFMVEEGKGAMTPFKKVLTEKEIERVAKYSHQLTERVD